MVGVLAVMAFAMLGAARHFAFFRRFAAAAFALRLGPGLRPMLRVMGVRGGCSG